LKILLGNEAIALGLLEQECRMVTAYPGTPSSEILATVVAYKKRYGLPLFAQWSINEKVALEIALAGSWAGLRTAVAMKQVGLNVAADALFSAAYTGVKGGFLVIAADDPGLHSSQTEQDSRLIALAAKVPVFDPSTPAEARQMVGDALSLSERYRLPVMLRPTTRLCHAVQSLALDEDSLRKLYHANGSGPTPRFRKDPLHWVAMPRQRYQLHLELAEKLSRIEAEFAESSLNYVVNGDAVSQIGIITSGVVFHTIEQTLLELGLSLPILKIGTPYPLPQKLVNEFMASLKTTIVLEETDACIELQLSDRRTVRGRLDGLLPAAGELAPELVAAVLRQLLDEAGYSLPPDPADAELAAVVSSLPLPMRRPRLCPGCAHRSAFFSLKREFGPKAIYAGDIGCYTLGANLRAMDTLLDMGASITMAEGLYQAGRLAGDERPIIATIGDSTFLHAGVPALLNAVHNGSRFVLIILDNHTTAMTGFQPTAASDLLTDGSSGARPASLMELARACGASFVRETDPYEQDVFRTVLRQAHEHTLAADGRVAVIIANRPCVLYDPSPVRLDPQPVIITEECDGCRYCLEAFECPALYLQPDGSRVDINYQTCIDCGQCVDACYKGFIQFKVGEGVGN
jgi:indolepyruvate ferredoxin oxidoreductase, alpha subunit